MTKQEARLKFLKIRKSLSKKTISKEKMNIIIESGFIRCGMNIGIYYPILNEIDLLPLVNLFPNTSFYLPITRDVLEFVRYQKTTQLIPGPFHTVEPVGACIPLSKLDAIFIPCLAIHKNKKRLGYGKGFYDRTLQNYKGMKIGVCYDCLCNQEFDTDEFDLMLDWII